MVEIPMIFQIRRKSMIAYGDYSVLKKNNDPKEIVLSGRYTASAMKLFKKYLELWNYSCYDYYNVFSFITLTLSSKMDKNTNYSNYLKNILEKLNTRYGMFNYAWKIEFQKNGNLHFHIIIDKEIDWKIVRSQWNKIQKNHVDEYQQKMKLKYKNGYYFDNEMIDYKNEIVDEETQKKRYEKGYKANWRNPNSTDVKIPQDNNSINGYISKYVAKADKEDSEEKIEHSIKRFYGCSDTLRELSYGKIVENDIDYQNWYLVLNSVIKEIKDEKFRTLCTVHEKITSPLFEEIEKKTLEKNRKILDSFRTIIESKKVKKELKLYDKLFE